MKKKNISTRVSCFFERWMRFFLLTWDQVYIYLTWIWCRKYVRLIYIWFSLNDQELENKTQQERIDLQHSSDKKVILYIYIYIINIVFNNFLLLFLWRVWQGLLQRCWGPFSTGFKRHDQSFIIQFSFRLICTYLFICFSVFVQCDFAILCFYIFSKPLL